MSGTWTTRDGRTLTIDEMTGRHLVHATNMVLREGAALLLAESLYALEAAASMNGEMAQYACENESLALVDALDHAESIAACFEWRDLAWARGDRARTRLFMLRNLVAETKRRGLFAIDPQRPSQLVVPAPAGRRLDLIDEEEMSC